MDDSTNDPAQEIRELREAQAIQEQKLTELSETLSLIVDVMEGKQVINSGHRRLIAKIRKRTGRNSQTVRLAPKIDKYKVLNSEVDCGARLHLCHARCCTFAVKLTEDDVREGKLLWNLHEPYMLQRDSDGYCSHIDRRTGGCGVYEHRPACCREYTCRDDKRIWRDFDKMIPAPVFDGLRLLLLDAKKDK